MRTRMLGALSTTLIVIVGVGTGCGSSADYDNASRPPAPINVSVALTPAGVAVSPSRVGAGPVVLLIANESGHTRELTLAPPRGAQRGCVDGDTSSGPINPQGTARIQLTLLQGTCAVAVEGGGLAHARLTVGAERPSAQDDLLAP